MAPKRQSPRKKVPAKPPGEPSEPPARRRCRQCPGRPFLGECLVKHQRKRKNNFSAPVATQGDLGLAANSSASPAASTPQLFLSTPMSTFTQPLPILNGPLPSQPSHPLGSPSGVNMNSLLAFAQQDSVSLWPGLPTQTQGGDSFVGSVMNSGMPTGIDLTALGATNLLDTFSPDSSPMSTPSRPPGSRTRSLEHPSVGTLLVTRSDDDAILSGGEGDSDDDDNEPGGAGPSSASNGSKRVRPTRAFHPYGQVTNVMRGKAPLTVYRTKPRTGRLDDLKKSTRRFKDTMHRMFNSAEKLSDETGCWMVLAAQLPNATTPFLHWVSPTMEEEMPDIYLNRLRTMIQRSFDSLVAARRQDLVTIVQQKLELEARLQEMNSRMEEYATLLLENGIDINKERPLSSEEPSNTARSGLSE